MEYLLRSFARRNSYRVEKVPCSVDATEIIVDYYGQSYLWDRPRGPEMGLSARSDVIYHTEY